MANILMWNASISQGIFIINIKTSHHIYADESYQGIDEATCKKYLKHQ